MKKIFILLLLSVTSYTFAQEKLTVEVFKAKVLEYNQSIKYSVAQSEAMRSAVQFAKTAYLPAVNAAGSFQYSLKDRMYGIPTTTIAFPLERMDYGVGVELAQPVYTGGAINSKVESAKLQSQIAEKGIELTTANVLHACELAYWGAVAQKEMYRTMEKYVEIITSLRDIVNTKYQEGKISKTDFIQTENQLSQAKMQLIDTKLSYDLALQNLNIMMGKEPADVIELQDAISSMLDLPASVSAADALAMRPEMAIANYQVKLQEQQVKGAAANYNPSLFAGLSEGYGTSSMNTDNKGYWSHYAFLKLSIPIFNWNARGKSVATQRRILDSKRYEMQQQEDKIKQEVAQAWSKIVENSKKIEVAKENIIISDENLELNTFSYNEGRLTILDVLSAQTSWIASYTNMITAWYAQHSAIADYNKAIGK